MEFKLEGEEYIELQALLKVCGLCDTGGAAKHAIVEGQVRVDGEVETRRGRKIRAGQTVTLENNKVTVSE
ncbi:MAG TPA: RNA-binding S4 domain-containing protein [Bdellovibrionales bacterium]|jgi:ribosome-associated protein|nr:RNA-binding S4 domain-containing protein [Bdellovibrionales bacterium]